MWMFLLYSILYFIASILLLPFQYRKRPKKFRHRWLKEKFGFINSELQIPKSPLSPFAKGGRGGIIWIHAVSVGEVLAVIPLLYRLREKFPSANLMVSTITDTGQGIAIERVPEGTKVIYLPFDLIFVLKRALKNVRPDIFITIETELWPNIFRLFKREGIPIIVMNGRISDNAFKGYKKIKFFMTRVIECVDMFGMQESVYAERIIGLGANRERVKVIGNFKFDTRPPDGIPEWSRLLSSPVIVAGSTHRGEEDLIVSVFSRLKNDFLGLNLIIAPRHPERFKEVEDLLKSSGIPFVKRSELPLLNPPPQNPPLFPPLQKGGVGAWVEVNSELRTIKGRIIILDSVGELSSVYGISDIAIVGGSFIEHGGQNPLEPAYWGKPVLCGPHMENFPFVEDFYREGAAIKVDAANLYDAIKALLISPGRRHTFGTKAQELYRRKTGAVDEAVRIIGRYINAR